MNPMPPTQTLAIQQQQQLQQQHRHHQQQKQMQHQNSLPQSNSAGGSWYGVSSGQHGSSSSSQQTVEVSSRTFSSNSASLPDGYAMTSVASGAGDAGARTMVPYYEGGPAMMQKASRQSHGSPEYNQRQAMMSNHVSQNGYLSNGMMMMKGYGGQNDLMIDGSSSVTMPTHQMMSPGVGSRVISPNGDYYDDQRMTDRPMYSQQFDACISGQGSMVEGIRTQMGPGMGGPEMCPDAMVCRNGQGSLPHQQQQQQQQQRMMMGYQSSSSHRVMPYPNPQQYMQNKRAQYNGHRKIYDYDPTIHQYGNGCYGNGCYGSGCYGNGWPRQSLPQQAMVPPDYPPGGAVQCHVKEDPDSYLQMSAQNQWLQVKREPVQRNNNAFSPPPGNPTPPMTPGSTSMPCSALDASDVVPSNGMRTLRENELYFTFPVHDGMIKAPFQLEHNAPVSCHIFNLNDQLHESLMARPDLELMLKCFHKEDRLLATNWPNSVSISLNEVPLMIDRGVTQTSTHQPIFLRSICKPGQNALQISVATCCCSHLFVLQIVHRPSVRSVFQGLITKRLLPASNTVGKIKRLLSQVTMIPPVSTNEQQNLPLPLTCPLSMQRIVVPSRGRDCQHIQCFDLVSYLKLNCHRNHWYCPLCKKMAALDGLEVDQFVWAVLDHPSSACSDAVLLDISANWKPLPRPGTEYGSEAAVVVFRKYVMSATMPLPSPGNYTTGKGTMTSGMTVPVGSSVGHQKEMAVQERRHQKTMTMGEPSDAPNYLGCLSQMTSVFLGQDTSPSVAPPQTNNMEQMSFPPTPMGSQISQICTPLDGQSLHPRTPSEGHATHPHTPPDGHPFTPLDSQSHLVGRTPPESHGTVGINPNTPSTGFELCSSSKRGTDKTASDVDCLPASVNLRSGVDCPPASVNLRSGVDCPPASVNLRSGVDCPPASVNLRSGSNSEGDVSEFVKEDRSGLVSGASESMENRLMTEDLTKLDFKSNLSLCDDNQEDMMSLLPESFDYDLSDLTCYLGGGSSGTKTTSGQKSTTKALDDDDFMSFLN